MTVDKPAPASEATATGTLVAPGTASSLSERPMVAERRWPASAAFVTAWLFPAATARRTQHVSLRRAYAIHFAVVLATPLLALAVTAWGEAYVYSNRASTWSDVFQKDFAEFVDQFRRYPEDTTLAIAGTLLTVESGFFVVAVLLTPWGAGDERVRTSFANSLRHVWLHTTHVLPLVCLLGALIVALANAQKQPASRPPPGAYPMPPTTTQSAYAPEWQKYNADAETWWAEQNAWQQSRPWCARNAPTIVGYAFFCGLTWFFWALFRAVGARRRVQSVTRPPLCEACGYNLTATQMDGRCPECGRPIAESLGPDVRRGTLWQRRREVGFVNAWWRCVWDPILRPTWFGRQVQVASPGADHRWFLAINLVPLFVVGAVGLLASYAADEGRNRFRYATDVVWLGAPLTGWIVVVIMASCTLFAAAAIGVSYRVSDKRNLMRGAVQVTAYLSGYLLLWAALAALGAVVAFLTYRHPLVRSLPRTLHMNRQSLAAFAWFALNVVCAGVYAMLVSRAMIGLRYANR